MASNKYKRILTLRTVERHVTFIQSELTKRPWTTTELVELVADELQSLVEWVGEFGGMTNGTPIGTRTPLVVSMDIMNIYRELIAQLLMKVSKRKDSPTRAVNGLIERFQTVLGDVDELSANFQRQIDNRTEWYAQNNIISSGFQTSYRQKRT